MVQLNTIEAVSVTDAAFFRRSLVIGILSSDITDPATIIMSED